MKGETPAAGKPFGVSFSNLRNQVVNVNKFTEFLRACQLLEPMRFWTLLLAVFVVGITWALRPVLVAWIERPAAAAAAAPPPPAPVTSPGQPPPTGQGGR